MPNPITKEQLKVGDKVTATFQDGKDEVVVTGIVRSESPGLLSIGGWVLTENGQIGGDLLGIDEHEPALNPEPTGDCIVWFGWYRSAFAKNGNRWENIETGEDSTWEDLTSNNPAFVVYRSEVDSQNNDELQAVGNLLDRTITVADELSAAIAPPDVLGKHSPDNDPWQNAIDYARGLKDK
jgi:hypothetical protein